MDILEDLEYFVMSVVSLALFSMMIPTSTPQPILISDLSNCHISSNNITIDDIKASNFDDHLTYGVTEHYKF